MEEVKKYGPEQQEEQSAQRVLQLRDIWNIFWGHRLWFLASVLICLAIAALYILKKPKTYSSTATVLVKNQRRGGGVSQAALFQDIGGFGMVNNDVNNSTFFNSRRLILVYKLYRDAYFYL